MNTTINSTTGPGCGSFTIHCLFSTEERYAIVVSMLIIAVASLIGNVLVCCAFFADNKKGSALTLSSLHLAIANLLITIFWGPAITIYLYIMGEWKLGHVMCKLMAFMQNTGVVASLLHLLVVTVEKYLAVCFPFVFRRANKLAYRCSLAVVWLIALGESAFYMQFKDMKTFKGNNYCIENWPDKETFHAVTLTKTVVFFLSLLAIVILLGLTIFELRYGKANYRPETSRRDDPSWRRKRALQARAVKILLVMLLAVLVCWSPLHSLSLLDLTDSMSSVSVRGRLIAFTVSLVFFFSVCPIHPIIFLFVSRRGREFMQHALSKISSSSSRESGRRGRTSSEFTHHRLSSFSRPTNARRRRSAMDGTNPLPSRQLPVDASRRHAAGACALTEL